MSDAPDNSNEVERRLAEILRRYPGRFDDEHIGRIRKRIDRSINLGRSLRAYPLGNSDGPAFHPLTMHGADQDA